MVKLGQGWYVSSDVDWSSPKVLTSLKREMEFAQSPHQEKNRQFRWERIGSLESMLDISSNSLTAMSSQLSEEEEREHSLHAKTRWNSIQSMTDAKCSIPLPKQDMDIKEQKEQVNYLFGLLQLSEVQNREILTEKKTREHTLSIAPTSSAFSVTSRSSSKHYGDNNASNQSSPSSYHRATKHLKYAVACIVNVPIESKGHGYRVYADHVIVTVSLGVIKSGIESDDEEVSMQTDLLSEQNK